jgi:hypothetical protein
VLFAAVLAFSLVGVASAFADSALTPGANPAFITGEQATAQKLILTASGTTVKCSTANLSATTTGTTVIEATASPTYGGCTIAGLSSPVDTNKCTYTITNTTTALTAKADITNCPLNPTAKEKEEGKGPITITQAGCNITIGNQGPLGTITFANSTGVTPADVTANLNITGITYTGDTGCPANVLGTHSDGDLTGSYTLKAFKDESGKEGAQVSLTAD